MACWDGNSLTPSNDSQLTQFCTKHKVHTSEMTSLCGTISEYLGKKESILVSGYSRSIQVCLLEYYLNLFVNNSNSLIFLHISGFSPEFLDTLDISSSPYLERLDKNTSFKQSKRVYLVVHQDYYNFNNIDVSLINNNNILFVFISNHVLSPFLMPGLKYVQNLIFCPKVLENTVRPFAYTHIFNEGESIKIIPCSAEPKTSISRLVSNNMFESLILNFSEKSPQEFCPLIMSDQLLNNLIQKYLVLDFELLDNIAKIIFDKIFENIILIIESLDVEIMTCLVDYIIMKLDNDNDDACVLVYYDNSLFEHILKLDVLLYSEKFAFVTSDEDFSKKILFSKHFGELEEAFKNRSNCFFIACTKGNFAQSYFSLKCPSILLSKNKIGKKKLKSISNPCLLIGKDPFSNDLYLTPKNACVSDTAPTNVIEKNSKLIEPSPIPFPEIQNGVEIPRNSNLEVTNVTQTFDLSSDDDSLISRVAKKYNSNPVKIEKLCAVVLHHLDNGDSLIVDNFNQDVLCCLFEYVVSKKSADMKTDHAPIYFRPINLQNLEFDCLKSEKVLNITGSELKSLMPLDRGCLYVQFYVSIYFINTVFSEIGCQVLGLARSNLAHYCDSNEFISHPFVSIRHTCDGEFIVKRHDDKKQKKEKKDDLGDNPISEMFIDKSNPIKLIVKKLVSEHNLNQPDFLKYDAYLTIFSLLLENKNLILEGFDLIILMSLLQLFALHSQTNNKSVFIFNCSDFYDPAIPNSKSVRKEYFQQNNPKNDLTQILFLFLFVNNELFSEIHKFLPNTHQYVLITKEEIQNSLIEQTSLIFTHISSSTNSVYLREISGVENICFESSISLEPTPKIPEIEIGEKSPRLPNSDENLPYFQIEDKSFEIPQISFVEVDEDNPLHHEETQLNIPEIRILETINLIEKSEDTSNECDLDSKTEISHKIETRSDTDSESKVKSETNPENINHTCSENLIEAITENVNFENLPESENQNFNSPTKSDPCMEQRYLESSESESPNTYFSLTDPKSEIFQTENPENLTSDDDYQSCSSNDTPQPTKQQINNDSEQMLVSKEPNNVTDLNPQSKSDILSEFPIGEQENNSKNTISESSNPKSDLNPLKSEFHVELITNPLQNGLHTIIYSSYDLFYIPIVQHVANVFNPSIANLQIVLASDSSEICSLLFKLLSTKVPDLDHGFLYKSGSATNLSGYVSENNVQILFVPLNTLISLIREEFIFLDSILTLLVYVEDTGTRDIHSPSCETLLETVSKQFIFVMGSEQSISVIFSTFPRPSCEIRRHSKNESFSIEFNSD